MRRPSSSSVVSRSRSGTRSGSISAMLAATMPPSRMPPKPGGGSVGQVHLAQRHPPGGRDRARVEDLQLGHDHPITLTGARSLPSVGPRLFAIAGTSAIVRRSDVLAEQGAQVGGRSSMIEIVAPRRPRASDLQAPRAAGDDVRSTAPRLEAERQRAALEPVDRGDRRRGRRRVVGVVLQPVAGHEQVGEDLGRLDAVVGVAVPGVDGRLRAPKSSVSSSASTRSSSSASTARSPSMSNS